MKLTPIDIQHKQFKKALQGYARDDVDAYLDEIIETLEAEIEERSKLEAQIAELEDKLSTFKAMEESLKSTLVLAQRTADEMRASVHKETDLIKQQARMSLDTELVSVKQQIVEAKRELQRLVEQCDAVKEDMRVFLNRQLALVEETKKTQPALFAAESA